MTTSTYRPVQARGAKPREIQLELFSWLVPLRARTWLRPVEAAQAISMSREYICGLIAAGELESYDTAATEENPKRRDYRITVRSFLVHVVTHSTLSAEDWDEMLATFADKMDLRSIDRLLALLTARRARLSR